MTTVTSKFALFTIIIAATGGILYGYEIGMINAAILFIKESIPLSPAETSFTVAAVFAGSFLSTLLAGPLSDRFGRRNLMVYAAIFFIAGVVTLATAWRVDMLILGRLIQGMGIGIVSIIIPLYLSETVPAGVRGRGVGAFQLLLAGGIVCSNLVGYYFAQTHNWRAMIWTATAPGLLLLAGLFFLPESPRWLYAKNNPKKALAVLAKMTASQEGSYEFKFMQEIQVQDFGNWRALAQLVNPLYLYPLTIVFAAAILQQLSGINAFLQYNATLLDAAGFRSDVTAILGGVSISIINLVVTVISLLLVDRVGRRPLLNIGLSGMVVALIGCAGVFFILPYGPLRAELLLSGLIMFIIFYGVGPGLIVWLILSELLPLAVRGTGMGLALCLNALGSTLLSSLFIPLSDHIGYAGIFILCAIFALIYWYIAVFKIPETKNKTLEEIEYYFKNRHARR